MSESFEAVEHRGRRYGTAIPNWRIQDEALTPHQFRIACYLSSDDPSFLERKVTRNFIASQLSMNVTTVSTSIDALEALGIVAREEREIPLAEGGKRWVLVFDHEVWETDPTLERNRSTPRSEIAPPPRAHTTMSNTLSLRDDDEALDAFDRFWAKYPNVKGRKRSKDQVRSKFMIAYRENVEQLRVGVKWWLAHWALPANAPYVPAPLVFFNQRWWDQDFETATEPHATDPNPFVTMFRESRQRALEVES